MDLPPARPARPVDPRAAQLARATTDRATRGTEARLVDPARDTITPATRAAATRPAAVPSRPTAGAGRAGAAPGTQEAGQATLAGRDRVDRPPLPRQPAPRPHPLSLATRPPLSHTTSTRYLSHP